jgi:hypothetical protein
LRFLYAFSPFPRNLPMYAVLKGKSFSAITSVNRWISVLKFRFVSARVDDMTHRSNAMLRPRFLLENVFTASPLG